MNTVFYQEYNIIILVSMVNSNILFKRTNLSRNILLLNILNITRNRIFVYNRYQKYKYINRCIN